MTYLIHTTYLGKHQIALSAREADNIAPIVYTAKIVANTSLLLRLLLRLLPALSCRFFSHFNNAHRTTALSMISHVINSHPRTIVPALDQRSV